MTDQTVPVPVDLLQRLMDNTTITRDVFDGDSVEVRPSGIGAIIDLKSFIPVALKVGDHPTAEQAFDLPVRSTFVDDDGDTYVVYGTGKIRRVTNYLFDDSDTWEEWEVTRGSLIWSDLTITSIPAGD